MRSAGFMVLLFGVASLGAQGVLTQRTPEGEAAARKAEQRVVLDVQVSAADGSPVRGLTQKDFVLEDAGQAVPMTSFRELGSGAEKTPAEAILLLDTMNATFSDVTLMRQGLDHVLRGDSGRLRLPVTIVFLTDTGIQIDKPSQDGNQLADELDGVHSPLRVLIPSQGFSGAQDRLQRSLRALQMLMRYSGDRPTRKLVVWIGPGWPFLAGPNLEMSERDHRRFFDSIVETTTALRRARFTVYSVAPLNFSQGTPQFPFFYKQYLSGTKTPAEADSPELATQVLATRSGGLVLSQTGDLAGGIERCLADADSWYEIALDAAAARGARYVYHPLAVEVHVPGVKTRTQASYYAGLPEEPFSASAALRQKKISDDDLPPVAPAEARTVVLDVLVRDSTGAPVRGLKASDFTLEEEGQPRPVSSIEEHAGSSGAKIVAAAAGARTIEVSNKPPEGGGWNVLAIDLLNTPKEERGRLLGELQELARKLPPATPVALVLMPGRLQVVTTFSEGPSGLLHALAKGFGSAGAGVSNVGEQPVFETIPNGIKAIEHKGNVDLYRQADRSATTLEEFSALARWLKAYPGRKNVFWLSAGFPLEEEAKVARAMDAPRMAIYPVGLRGPATAAAERDRMTGIAHATGGEAYFGDAVAQMLAEEIKRGSSYYALSFAEEAATWDGKFHRLKLTSDRAGVELAYRERYFARDVPVSPAMTLSEFAASLRPSEVTSGDMLFTARATKGNGSAEVEYRLEPATVSLAAGAGGKLLVDVDCAVVEFDAKGKVLAHSMAHLSGAVTQQQREHLTSQLLRAKQTIDLKSGAEVLMIGVRDGATGKVGSLEVRIGAL